MISRDEMLNLANLSKLYLNEDEIEDAMKEMDGMIDFANQINEMILDSDETPNINGLSNSLSLPFFLQYGSIWIILHSFS